MNITQSFRLNPFALIVLLLLPYSPSLAENQSTGKPELPTQAQTDPYRITIDFPGGPFSKLVASLALDKGSNLSIINTEKLDPILPAFSVRNAKFDAVFVALGRVLEPQGYNLGPVDEGVAVLTKADPAREQAFASFQLERKLGSRSVEDVISAIQAGCEFSNPEQKPAALRFKFHPGTKLLFVAGPRKEIQVAEQIFSSLPENPLKDQVPPSEKK